MKNLLSKTSIFIAGGVIIFLAIQIINWYNPPDRSVLYRLTPTPPYEAATSRLEARIPEVDREVVPKEIVVLKPNKEAKEKIEKKLDGKLPVGPLLGIKEIKNLPYGGRGVISLEVDKKTGGEKAVLTIYPKKPPFFEWKLDRSIGVWGGVGMGKLSGQVWNVEFEQNLFRVGPVELSAKTGLLVSPGGSDGYVLVGGKVRF